MLANAIVMQHIRCVVKNVTTGKRDHDVSKNRSELETEYNRTHDEAHRSEAAEHQRRSQERKIFPRDEHDRRQTDKQTQRRDSGRGYDAGVLW